MKILVVEDEMYARKNLLKQIRDYDINGAFELLEASNGEEGEQLCRQYNPELVLTDIKMPKMDGIQLLKSIHEFNPEIKVIILSAYSDFEFAHEALVYGATDYLLKPIMEEKLVASLDQFLEQNQRDKKEVLLSGRDMTTQYIINCIEESNPPSFVEQSMFERLFPNYQIGAIYFCDAKPDSEEFLAGIEKIYGNEFWSKFRFWDAGKSQWLIIVGQLQDQQFLWRHIQALLGKYASKSAIGISKKHNKADEVGKAFHETQNALEYKIYGSESIFYYEKIENEELREYFLPKKKENEFLRALAYCNEKKAINIIREIFNEFDNSKKIKIECVELLYSQIILTLRRSISLQDTDFKIKSLHDNILKFDSIKEMREYLERIAPNICSMQRNFEPQKNYGWQDSGRIVEKMTEYIQSHYQMDITVKELAENVLFMNQNYISHLFVEKKGISFSKYLRQIRVEHAEKLLKDSKYSVTEIATMVGYNDTSQFIRVFKQETGDTPKRYRVNIKSKDSEI